MIRRTKAVTSARTDAHANSQPYTLGKDHGRSDLRRTHGQARLSTTCLCLTLTCTVLAGCAEATDEAPTTRLVDEASVPASLLDDSTFEVIRPAQLGTGINASEPKEWTVFVYGDADNNLSASFVRDLGKMAAAEIDPQVNVIVLADFDASETYTPVDENDSAAGFVKGQPYPSGAHWLHVTGRGAVPEQIAVEPELNLDDEEVLAGAIEAVFSKFPARHRAVILWDHGGGWFSGFGGDSQDGTLAPTSLKSISTHSVASAVASGLQGAGVTTNSGDPPLSLFGFDTCLLGTVEVAYEFRALTPVYEANAEIDYGDGWNYTAFLTYLSQHRDADAHDLAKAEVRFWDELHAQTDLDDTLLRSHVAIDTSALTQFVEALRAFGDAWRASDVPLGEAFGREAFFSDPAYFTAAATVVSQSRSDRDVGQFLRGMLQVPNAHVTDAARAALDALDRTLLARSQGQLRETAQQFGLSITLAPAVTLTPQFLDEYAAKNKDFAAASRWNDVLKAYAAMDDHQPPEPTAELVSTTPGDEQVATLRLSTASRDVVEATVEVVGTDPTEPTRRLNYGIIGHGNIESGRTYEFAWDGEIAAIPTAEGGEQPVSIRVWLDMDYREMNPAGASVLAIAGTLACDDDIDSAHLLFQDGDTESSIVVLNLQQAFPVSYLSAGGCTFTPVISATSAEGSQVSVPGSPVPLVGDSLPIDTIPAPADGEYSFLTAISDAYGNVGHNATNFSLAGPVSQSN